MGEEERMQELPRSCAHAPWKEGLPQAKAQEEARTESFGLPQHCFGRNDWAFLATQNSSGTNHEDQGCRGRQSSFRSSKPTSPAVDAEGVLSGGG